jgi:hypothetical protein
MIAYLRPAAAGLSLLFGTAVGAFAADGPAYPISVPDGENSRIEHGPGNARGTLVGGGRAVAGGTGEESSVRHLDGGFVQQAPAGMVAVTVGSGENASIVYVPATRG